MLIILMLHGSVDPPFSCFNKKFSIKIGHAGDSNSHKTHEAYCASANFIHCAIPKCSAALTEPVKQHDINWTLVELCKSLHFHTHVYDVTDQAAAQAEDGWAALIHQTSFLMSHPVCCDNANHRDQPTTGCTSLQGIEK